MLDIMVDQIQNYNTKEPLLSPPLTVFSTSHEIDDMQLLFLQLSDQGRITRGLKLSEPTLTQKSNTHITGTLRRYLFDIDVAQKTIRHNCGDWQKGVQQKRLCKHVIKLFNSLPAPQATTILLDIIQNKSQWQFLAE